MGDKADSIGSMLKIVPQLEEAGWATWKMKLMLCAFQYEWYDPDDYDDEDKPWTPMDLYWEPEPNADGDRVAVASNAKVKKARRMCYTTIANTIDKHDHHIASVPMGHCGEAYEALAFVFERRTIAALIVSKKEFFALSMQNTKLDIARYCAHISSAATLLRQQDEAITEKDKIAVLLGGLLPEFKLQKTIISQGRMATLKFKAVEKSLVDFALSEKIEHLKQGGSKGDNVFMAGAEPNSTRNRNKQPCYNWQETGKCSFGQGCRFSHDVEDDGAGRNKQRRAGNGGGGRGRGRQSRRTNKTCSYCSKPGHTEDECFVKEDDEARNSNKSAAFHAAVRKQVSIVL
jgi:hypothetical protein